MEFNLKEKQLLQEIVKKYKQGLISGILQGDNITLTPTGCRNKIISSTGGGGTSYVPPYLKTGGASWSGTGLVYDVSGLEYYFNGDKLAAATQVTLDASDPDDNRLDAIVVDEAGVVSVIKGEASASPISPSVDESHILVQYILVEAGSTQPTIAKEDIYLENVEWTTSTYTTGAATGSIDFDNAVSPKQGVKCISANADARLGARFVRATSFDPYQYTMLSMWVRFTGSNVATNKSLNVRFENGAGALVANTINLFNFGLQRNLLNVWQLVVIPITSFGALPTSVKGLKIIMTGGTVGQARQWDIDLISLTDNSVPSINEQAFNILKDGALVGQSSSLNFKGASVNVTNDNINNKIDVEVIGGGGGAYIPLTGTEVGNPVTGNIEFNNVYPFTIGYSSYWDNIGLFYEDDYYKAIINQDGVNYIDNFTGYTRFFQFAGSEYYLINSTDPSFKGIRGGLYYGANYDDNTYVQKKYVDELVTANSVTPLSSLSPATSANVIDNGNKTQEWQWNSQVNQPMLKLSSTSIGAVTGGDGLEVNLSGPQVNNIQNTYAGKFINTRYSGASTHNGAYFQGGSSGSVAIQTGGAPNIAIGNNGRLLWNNGLGDGAFIQQVNARYMRLDPVGQLIITPTFLLGVTIGKTLAQPEIAFGLQSETRSSIAFGADNVNANGTDYRSYGTSAAIIERNAGKLLFSANVGLAGGYNNYTPTYQICVDGTNNNVAIGKGNTAGDASAKLEVSSTTQGFLPPRMTATQASAIASPAKSLIVYVTDTNGTFTSAGIWIYTTSWKLILAE